MGMLGKSSGGSGGGITNLSGFAALAGGENAVTAFAGGGQTNATQLLATVSNHRVSTVATAADSVKLPAATVGQVHYVRNDGAFAMQVFGQATETINAVASATGISQGAGMGVWYVCTLAGAWTTDPVTAFNAAQGTGSATSYRFSNMGPGYGFYSTSGTTVSIAINSVEMMRWASTGIQAFKGTTCAGWGIPAILAVGRVTAQSAANASIATVTNGAADGSFEVSANMNVTASTTLSTSLFCTYTDESNTSRTMIFPITALTGSFVALGAITGAGATVWETPTMHIRCKASTAITIGTSAGTFTGVTYTAEGIIKQMA